MKFFENLLSFQPCFISNLVSIRPADTKIERFLHRYPVEIATGQSDLPVVITADETAYLFDEYGCMLSSKSVHHILQEGMMMKNRWKRFCDCYAHFVERKGFAVVITVCVAAIAASAVWAREMEPVRNDLPDPPIMENVSAAQLIQERLADAATPTPLPEIRRESFTPPLDDMIVISSFDDQRFVRSDVTGIWHVHDAVDLQTKAGTPVKAIGKGKVETTEAYGPNGISVTISHGDSILVTYGNLSMIGAVQPGDMVVQGQTIGFAGQSIISEKHLDPHVHLQVLCDGSPIDPMVLFEE